MRYSIVFSALALGLFSAVIAEVDTTSYPYTTGKYVILKPVSNTIYPLPDPTHAAISKRNDLYIPPTDSPEWIAKGCRDNGRGRTHCIGGHTQIPAWKRDQSFSLVTPTNVTTVTTTSSVNTATNTLLAPETMSEDSYGGCLRPGSPEWIQEGCSGPCQCRGGHALVPTKRTDYVEHSAMTTGSAARVDEIMVQNMMLPPLPAEMGMILKLDAISISVGILRNASSGFTTLTKSLSEG